MGFGRRLAKFLIWGGVVGLGLAAAATWFAYAFVTDGDTVTRLIRAELRRFFPHAEFEFGSVDFRPLRGKATLKQVAAIQKVDGRMFRTLNLPWLEVRFNAWRMLQGEQSPSEVVVTQPTLRLLQKKDGGWNLLDLPAHPWPRAAIENPPPIDIVNGTVELVVERSRGGNSLVDEPASAAGDDKVSAAILREVTLRIEPTEEGRLEFKGSARGDLFDRVDLRGSVDPATGDVDLTGGLVDLTLSDTLRRRLPADFAAGFDALSLSGGDVDVELKHLAFRPGLPPEAQLSYDVEAQLLRGVCACPHLPFPLNDLSARVGLRDGVLTIVHAEGFNGATRVRASGALRASASLETPMDLRVEIFDLDLDQRLKDRTPPEFVELWDVFQPKGRVNVKANVARAVEGGPVEFSASAELQDVSARYRHFDYPLKNLKGTLALEGRRLTVDLNGPIGDKPARLHGTVDDPGPDALVDLKVEAESVPVDAAFLDALQPEVRRWVDRFKPAGSVKTDARIFRAPLVGPPQLKQEGGRMVEANLETEVGRLVIDADLDLDPRRCEITWVELPFPVRNLSGRLELHPDLWIFKDLRGRNGQAVITGSGKVEKLPGPNLPNGDPPLKIGMTLDAQNLPFSPELREALPDAWRKSWEFINPDGASDVHADVAVETGKPDQTRVTISPRPESHVRLVVPKSPGPGVEPGATIELKMQNALGAFEFVNGKVAMRDVRFTFHGAPVEFPEGTVVVEDSGRFDLAVRDVWVRDLLFGANLRRIMPTLMAQFAMRLDDGRPFTARGDLKIGWSGEAGVPAWCQWENTRVFLVDNKLKAGIPMEHLNGQLKEVWGRSDGQYLEVHGVLDIQSASVAGLQVTRLQGPLVVKDGKARLESLKGSFLGGELYGEGAITLAETPSYSGSAQLSGAQLQEYARSLPGRQAFRGLVNARVGFNGLGTDFRGLQARGEGHVVDGDLGELPFVLKFAKALNPLTLRGRNDDGKSMFDAADLEFRIVNGTTHFDKIRLTGSPISLEGDGTRDPFDNIDLTLRVLYGRNRFDVPLLSPMIREASGEFINVNIKGTLAQPRPDLKYVPRLQRIGNRGDRP
ncbi:AsmA-like C-terminal region-containing protein [Planctomyces sp. SH-PL62]|uniref:AsmA family protein n=1 Tax=Planctomyces sp. SH-PL62 TaxID=1636152 RepID=UPI00078B5F1E|nr:AsmA-like C-terminal region-containing protein [Planctomyces sp. SH-PL62]AMV40392.1 AsmA family protein [Planctomyces sp. SH-PL62]